jgi:hypothetical protein
MPNGGRPADASGAVPARSQPELRYPCLGVIQALPGKTQSMYTSIRRYQLVKGTPDLVQQKVDATFLPRISDCEGFVSYAVVVTGLGGDGLPGVVTISVFEQESQAKASSRLAADWAAEMARFFVLEKIGEESGRIISRTGVG